MQKKRIALAVGAYVASSIRQTSAYIQYLDQQGGPADFLKPRPFGHGEKPWGKKNRRKLGGMKGGAA